MSGVAYIRFFPDDWLAGVQDLSLEERGALITIVALTASTGQPPKDDFQRLARRFGCTPGRSKKVIDSLIRQGKLWLDDGEILNRRALDELENSQKNSQKQSQIASKRWEKFKKKSNEINSSADAMAMPETCQPEPEPEEKYSSYISLGDNDAHGSEERYGKGRQPDLLDSGPGEGSAKPENPKPGKRGARRNDPPQDPVSPECASGTSRPARARACPEDFWPDTTGQNKFRESAGTDLRAAVEHFIDYWRGKGEPRKDWDATWRTWCARGKQYQSPGFGSPGQEGYGRHAGSATAVDIHFAATRAAAAQRADEEGY